MKTTSTTLLMAIILMMIGFCAHSQIVIPNNSPFASLTQSVGLNQIKIEYVRPNVGGRVIFGDVVPFGVPWLNNDECHLFG